MNKPNNKRKTTSKEIPLNVLMNNRSVGKFKNIPQTVLRSILSYIPLIQSAFDYVLPALCQAYLVYPNLQLLQGVEVHVELTNAEALSLTNKSRKIIELVLKQGINSSNKLAQKWIAARGPMPYSNVGHCYENQSLRISLCKLINLLHIIKDFFPENTIFEARKQISELSDSWDGIHGWTHDISQH